jgi:hypothetical protein
MKEIILIILIQSFILQIYCQEKRGVYTSYTKDSYFNELFATEKYSKMTNYLKLSINEAEKGFFPDGTAINISVTFTKVLVDITSFYVDYSGGTQTYLFKKDFNCVSSPAPPVNLTFHTNVNEDWKGYIIPIDVPVGRRTLENRVDEIREVSYVAATIEVSSKGYETRRINVADDFLLLLMDPIELIPQVQNVKLSGGIDVNNSNANSNQQSSLNVYTTKQIADIIGLDENDIIALIKSKKLKAKLIGDKYVVRIEEFDAYMKQ